jgi:DNA-binding NarL/FixJ family response regulator
MPRKPSKTSKQSSPQQLAIAARAGVWTGLHAWQPSTLRIAKVELHGTRFAVIEVPTTSALDESKLSPAERKVLVLLLAGKSSIDIATERRVAERTIINQVSSIYRKLGVSGRGELLAMAGRPG